jgi:hypothetical protein
MGLKKFVTLQKFVEKKNLTLTTMEDKESKLIILLVVL